MRTFFVGLFVGLIAGAGLIFYFFGSGPHSALAPGNAVLRPDPNASRDGTARIVLAPEFFNGVLQTIFAELKPPAFAVGQQTSECEGKITIIPEGSGVRTGVVFENASINAPLAFSGSYASPVGCVRFTGSARSTLGLRFDPATQIVYGQLNVENVVIDGVNPFVSAIVTPFVQSSINMNLNPIRILDGRQLAVNLPITASQGNLSASIRDVRAEVKDTALSIDVIYDFSGSAVSPASPLAN